MASRQRTLYLFYIFRGALERSNIYALIWENRKTIITVEVRPSAKTVGLLFEEIKATKELVEVKEELSNIIKEIFQYIFSGCEVVFMKFPEPIFVEEERLNG